MHLSSMDIDPYKTLQVEVSASPLQIKKAYKKLSLQYHPDKIQQLKSEVDKDQFPKIQLAYSILSDVQKRHHYDTTGSLGGESPADFDWKEYFATTTEKITLDMIDEDRAKYVGSLEEKEDILHNFAFYDGDFLRLFEVIPHLEFDEALESRVFDIVESALEDGNIQVDKSVVRSWDKYKRSRKTKVKQMLSKMAREAKQAEKLAKSLKQKKVSSESDLKALIQKRLAGRMDDLISKLEAKYTKGKKRALPDDDEFDRIQEKMSRKR